ncbi:MAG: TldD/PmbA family protein [Silvanigrellales bacterium]|nr:TldD/PmbA family protein [Silvanigrellales bacterium]
MISSLKTLFPTASDPDVAWVGLRQLREQGAWRTVRDGRPENSRLSEEVGLFVEVLVDGQFAYAATNVLTKTAVRDAYLRAVAQARLAAAHKVFSFTPACRPPTRGTWVTPGVESHGARRVADDFALLVELADELRKGPKHVSSFSTPAPEGTSVVKAVAELSWLRVEMGFLSSSGAEFEQTQLISHVHLECVAQKGSVIQRRTYGGPRGQTRQAGDSLFDAVRLRAEAARVREQALELASAPNCPTGPTWLVLAPDQMMLQIHESIGHPLELDRILGDERNYAGSSFVKLSDFGTLQYGSPKLNVTFDPGVAGELASYGFDDTGVPAKREHLIQEGRLLRGLGGLESQARAGVPGVANMRATSWNRPAIDRMANINIEPGDASFESLLSGIERGVYMESNKSWSIDDYRNKFQFGCEFARLIENGKLTGLVRDPNYRGVTQSFWHALEKVGDASTLGIFGTPNCGKGEPNQVIRVGHASPVCAFRGVEVFGGES